MLVSFDLELVSEMTYTVSSGTLNSSIPYHWLRATKFGMVNHLEGRFLWVNEAYQHKEMRPMGPESWRPFMCSHTIWLKWPNLVW